MADPEDARDCTLAEQAQEQNSRLQRLIDAIAQLNSASRELLARLQPVKASGRETTKRD